MRPKGSARGVLTAVRSATGATGTVQRTVSGSTGKRRLRRQMPLRHRPHRRLRPPVSLTETFSLQSGKNHRRESLSLSFLMLRRNSNPAILRFSVRTEPGPLQAQSTTRTSTKTLPPSSTPTTRTSFRNSSPTRSKNSLNPSAKTVNIN